jgi:hypothetical protein
VDNQGFESKAATKVAKLILDCSDGPTINMRDGGLDEETASTEQAGRFFTKVVRAFALLDQMSPLFIQLVDEYHIGENPQATDCHLCKLREAAQEYLDGRQ